MKFKSYLFKRNESKHLILQKQRKNPESFVILVVISKYMLLLILLIIHHHLPPWLYFMQTSHTIIFTLSGFTKLC